MVSCTCGRHWIESPAEGRLAVTVEQRQSKGAAAADMVKMRKNNQESKYHRYEVTQRQEGL